MHDLQYMCKQNVIKGSLFSSKHILQYYDSSSMNSYTLHDTFVI